MANQLLSVYNVNRYLEYSLYCLLYNRLGYGVSKGVLVLLAYLEDISLSLARHPITSLLV